VRPGRWGWPKAMSRGGGVAGSSGVKGRRSGWAGLAGQHEERGGDEIGRHKPKE
jgi:hypothetical protein